MSDESAINRSPLLPDRYPQGDFFVCDIFDAVPKADMASMEHPIFSLSTKPDTRVRQYEHNGLSISIKPSVDGLATVHDRDVLIYCISHLISAINDGEEVSQVVRFRAYDMLVATNRNTAGSGYQQLKAALERLETLIALIEGWVETVVAAAVGDRLPGAAALSETLRRRRATGGPAEQTFATLVGLEVRPRKLREAATLWRSLTDQAGSDRRDDVWAHPDLLPDASDLDNPIGFVERFLHGDSSDFDDPIAQIEKAEARERSEKDEPEKGDGEKA